ncbi:LIC12231 family lipoprotein [Leptospira ilyithenensis]|uniref:Lipoprotein n=1 Tax=Leptospira ilyithenensis TaxID=2484901 RepID=A0A4R9LIQ0_9LEPT|nr:hypothetical protein [Leptospira ilyithenensis]TGN06525.1 hypothetical protein EHS11_19425 [Leptospira ilyithenensis]
MLLRILNLLLFAFSISNCLISYRDYDKIPPVPAQEKQYDSEFVYGLPTFPQFNLGGREALKTYFDSKSPFKKTTEGSDIPRNGYLVNVKVNYRSPSTPALAFITLSALTATILPAWSKQDGYDIQYHLYKNGKLVQVYEYHVFRNYTQWILLSFLVWVNLDSATEKEVFERVTNQFFDDAKSHF